MEVKGESLSLMRIKEDDQGKTGVHNNDTLISTHHKYLLRTFLNLVMMATLFYNIYPVNLPVASMHFQSEWKTVWILITFSMNSPSHSI